MRSVAPFGLSLLLMACGAGGGVGPAQAPQSGPAPSEPMPFDGKRMFWGGFEPIFDSADARQAEHA